MFDLEYRLDGEGDLRWLSDRGSSQKSKVHFHNKQNKYNKGLSRKNPTISIWNFAADDGMVPHINWL